MPFAKINRGTLVLLAESTINIMINYGEGPRSYTHRLDTYAPACQFEKPVNQLTSGKLQGQIAARIGRVRDIDESFFRLYAVPSFL